MGYFTVEEHFTLLLHVPIALLSEKGQTCLCYPRFLISKMSGLMG